MSRIPSRNPSRKGRKRHVTCHAAIRDGHTHTYSVCRHVSGPQTLRGEGRKPAGTNLPAVRVRIFVCVPVFNGS
jgi:hypothetical protein